MPNPYSHVKLALGVATLNYSKRMVDSLLRVVAQDGLFAGWSIPEVCLLPASRNEIVRQVRTSIPDFTHLLFIDDDMTDFTSKDVAKLVADTVDIPNCEIVSATVCTRKPPYRLVANFFNKTEEEMKDAYAQGLTMPSALVGLAFTVITRKVLDAIEEDTPNGPLWFHTDRESRNSFEEEHMDLIARLSKDPRPDRLKTREAVEFGMSHNRGSSLYGEDVIFCQNARKHGFESYVNLSVIVGHEALISVFPETSNEKVLDDLNSGIVTADGMPISHKGVDSIDAGVKTERHL